MTFPTISDFQIAAEAHGLTDAALYTPIGGNALGIAGKFTADYVEPFGLVEASSPAFSGSAAQFASGDPKQNDAVTIIVADGLPVTLAYRVKTVKRNTPTVGEVLLILKV